MRSTRILSVLVLCFAACGSGQITDDDGDDVGGIDAPRPDGPAPGTPLDERLDVTTVTAPAGVMAGRSNWRIWGTGDLRVAPVFTVPYGDCGTLIGYTTGTTTPTARVARLDPSDQLVTTHDLGAFELRGLAAEPDGHFAALLWDATQDPAELHVQRFDAAGAPGWSADLFDALAVATDFGIGESRLEYGEGQYGAYYHVHGISGFANGHEGDQLKWMDATSGAVSNGWSWGCSHSMSEVLRYDPGASTFLPACVTDCYPGTSGSNFPTDSIGGLYLNHDARKVLDIDGGCNGDVAGEIGSAAPADGGWKIVFNAHQAPASNGQGSYDSSTMDQDIGFASVAADLTPGAVVWLTTTPSIDEANASIARWQPEGEDGDQYVVGWAAGSTYQLELLSGGGAVINQPIDVTATAKWGERDDPFRVHLNADVIWSWFDAAGSTELHVARIASGRAAASCASF